MDHKLYQTIMSWDLKIKKLAQRPKVQHQSKRKYDKKENRTFKQTWILTDNTVGDEYQERDERDSVPPVESTKYEQTSTGL